MRKKIAVVILAVLLLSFFNNNLIVKATSVTNNLGESLTDIQKGSKKENYDSLLESGTTSTYGKVPQNNVPVQTQSPDILYWILKIVCAILMIVPYLANLLLSQITSGGQYVFTIKRTVSNEYDLFNLKSLFGLEKVGQKVDKTIAPLAENVAVWFVGIRNLAIVASIIMLIYVGARMAVATLATNKSDYKKMLFSGVEGIILLLLLHTLIIFFVVISDWMEDFLLDISGFSQNAGVEERVMTNILENMDKAHQINGTILYTALYITFAYYQFKFFVLYLGRMLKVAFYTIISPLVCVTLPIDKMGDGTAQAFNRWLLEISVSTFMQPIHLFIYIIAIDSLDEIMIRNPILAISFIILMSHAEKILKSVLKIKPNFAKGISDIKLSQQGE